MVSITDTRDARSHGLAPPSRACTKVSDMTTSERPKVRLSKSYVGVEPTLGSNSSGSAIGLLAKLAKPVCETELKTTLRGTTGMRERALNTLINTTEKDTTTWPTT
ncbi:hypothetical protein FB472_1033 [Rhodoglobus vestalii]|uniref:Uncharacterized protein n=1 Tax=Rhodoglobus vestalii TaxID=193384 RepID=A0A8H2PY83_9MICO|nr:hypothetical protein FB472_1033 [Rhodoglobus vestalii]